MKTIFFIFVLSAPFFCKAQESASKSDTLSISHEQYCDVIAVPRTFGAKHNIFVDFGAHKDQHLRDAAGKVIKFESAIDALNYMAAHGWILVNVFVEKSSDSNVPHYIMRKPAK